MKKVEEYLEHIEIPNFDWNQNSGLFIESSSIKEAA